MAVNDVLREMTDKVRAPLGSPVTPGIWNGDLDQCSAYALRHGTPMVAVWSAEYCAHCEILEKPIVSSAVLGDYLSGCGYVLCFTCSYDQYGKRQGDPAGDGRYYWFCKGPNNLSSYPFVRFWWPSGDPATSVDFSVRGDVVDGQQGIAWDPDAKAMNYEKAGRNVVDYIKNKSRFAPYRPGRTYCGGDFDFADGELQARLGEDPTLPLRRDALPAFEQTLSAWSGSGSATVAVSWADGQT
jgi:hypothetical protein